jgi:hypothetical protein
MVLSSEVVSVPKVVYNFRGLDLGCGSPTAIETCGEIYNGKETSTCGGLDCWALFSVTSYIGYCKDCKKEG